jgi:hypothetical protein
MYHEDTTVTVWKEKLYAKKWNTTSATIYFIITATALQLHGKKGHILKIQWTLSPHLQPLTHSMTETRQKSSPG